jgi:NAD(P)H-flavin reductase
MNEAARQVPPHLERVFYRPSLARVLDVRELTAAEKMLELEMEGGRPLGHAPGQFVQVYVFGHGEAPISVCSPPSSGSFQLCVRDVGAVSSAIHRLAPGDWVGIRGPYGKGFPMARLEGNDLLIVAGGIGLAPLRSVIMSALGRRDAYRRLIVVYGVRSPEAILFREDLRSWEADPRMEFITIVDQPDPSWKGRTGVVTLPLRDLEFEKDSRQVAAVVGPPVMYRFVAMELFKKNFDPDRIYFSLERRFRCGIGKCGHCQLNDVYVCQDGPVFRYSDLVGRTEAIEAWAPDANRE